MKAEDDIYRRAAEDIMRMAPPPERCHPTFPCPVLPRVIGKRPELAMPYTPRSDPVYGKTPSR